MPADRKHILSTGLLDEALLEKVRTKHDLDIIPFIAIEPIKVASLKTEIEELSEHELSAVFTSSNGVKAVAEIMNGKPVNWKLFSIEGVTSRAIVEHFGQDNLIATAFTGNDLAKEILKDERVKEVVFFCGDLRRDELPGRLRAHGVNVKEVVVYNTIATPVQLEKSYDAILLFSPSAVHSYASLNKINESTVCFAIGNTTATAIKNIVDNKVVVAQPPQKERVVEMLLEYYDK